MSDINELIHLALMRAYDQGVRDERERIIAELKTVEVIHTKRAENMIRGENASHNLHDA